MQARRGAAGCGQRTIVPAGQHPGSRSGMGRIPTIRPMFVHLRLHTEFSVVDGTARIDEVAKAASKDGQPALAITDLHNLFGAIKFYKEARGKGVKPVLGAEVSIEPETAGGPPGRILLLAQGRQGYLNLCEMLARAWTRNVVKNVPLCTWEWLQELGGDLIALSGAQAGPVGQAFTRGDEAGAARVALRLAGIFPHRFYLELQRAGRPEDESQVVAAVQLAARLNLPVVATQPTQFLTADDYEAHEARVCIAEGEILANPRRVRRFTREQYFKSSAQMEALFADVPTAIANTLEIAKRCSLTLVLGKPRLPDFPTPNGMPIEEYFRYASFEGLEERLKHLFPNEGRAREAAPALCGAPGVRAGHHPEDGLPGLLPHRGGLHPVGQAERLSGGAGPGLRRRLARGLRAQDHRSGPAAVQPAVRALPEPRAGLDARLRHRFLPVQPRPGDRLREGQVRQERREPDRHLRHHGGQGGDPRRGPRHGHELHLLRRHLQAGARQARHVLYAGLSARGEEGGRQEQLRAGARAHALRARAQGGRTSRPSSRWRRSSRA